MTFTEAHVNELCGVVVESCGSEDFTHYQALEALVVEMAFGPYDQDQCLTRQVQENLCQTDSYRIRNAVRKLALTNPAARELGGGIFAVLGFSPAAFNTFDRTKKL